MFVWSLTWLDYVLLVETASGPRPRHHQTPRRTTTTRCCWPGPPTAARRSALRSRSATTRPTRLRHLSERRRRRTGVRAEKADTANSIFRATNYPVGAVNPKTGAVMVTYGSYINRHSNENNGCVPTGFSAFGVNTYDGVKVPGACNNDILVSASATTAPPSTAGRPTRANADRQ